MSAFATLPEELWEMILSPLEKTDVSAISRCCKRLRERTIPHLYEIIDWTWNSDPALAEPCNPPIHLLLRSLVETRHLGSYVQCLQFNGWKNIGSIWQKRSPGTIWERGKPKCTADELQALKGYVHEVQLPSETLWITELEIGNVDVFVALVLSQLCNLRTLKLGVDFHVDTPFLALLFKRALFSSPPPAGFSTFVDLQHVHFVPMKMDMMPRKAFIDADQVTSLFYLPAIQSIQAVLYLKRHKFTWPGHNRPYALTLTTLVLPRCEADGTTLLHLLSASPNLHTLRYDYACNIDPPRKSMGDVLFDFAKLGRALGQVQTTLTQLSLSIDFYSHTCGDPSNRIDNWSLKNRLGDLQGFVHLQALSIPFVILFGLAQTPWSVEKLDGLLPRSIRRLCLKDDLSSWDDYEWSPAACLERLEDFLTDRKGTAPQLERLDLELRESHVWDWGEDMEAGLRDLCEGQGVQSVISKAPR